ncbi:MAG: hypothetical protein ATN36_02815 [Epulopiscium sp. Nele67-Bin005]|nr:MAG: hypothetical protein ATN36_02815 [Epulopiscium sp. Nele67-Bin005]
MGKLSQELIGKNCRVIMLGIWDIKGIILDIDEDWIKIEKQKSGKVIIQRRQLVSSITRIA